MSAIYIQKGKTIDYVATADTEAGDVIVLGTKVVVAACSGKEGETISVETEGVFSFPKGNEAVTQGAALYWDAANKKATTTSTSNTKIGYAVNAASATDGSVNIKLD